LKLSADYLVLLVIDGHYSQTKNLHVVDKVKENSVAIVSLPPYSENKMQPFNVGFMKPLKHFMHKKLKRV
jgi:hypothetical protein